MHLRGRAQPLPSVAMSVLVTLGCSAREADASTQSGRQNLGEIFVTANKFENSINKVALTITVLGAAQLEQQRMATLQELATAVPGLTFTQIDGNAPVYSLRGKGFNDTTLAAYPSMCVYLNQAPLSFPVLTNRTLVDFERVEVLRSPQGTLFGNNATDCVINYVVAKPTRDIQAGASLDYARFNIFAADTSISSPVNDNLPAHFAFKATIGGGWQKSISRPSDRNGAPDTYAARFLLDGRSTDQRRVQTNLNGWRDRTELPTAQRVEFTPNFPTASDSGFVRPYRMSSITPDWPNIPCYSQHRIFARAV